MLLDVHLILKFRDGKNVAEFGVKVTRGEVVKTVYLTRKQKLYVKERVEGYLLLRN